jgi:serine phosphatase RsbU (regulator of sigma subunit)
LLIVETFADGVLVGVIDALGHGEDAAATARIAADVLRAHPHESVSALISLCHQRLRSVRGAVMSLASFNAREATMSWAGVGNVEGLLVRADPRARPLRESLLLRNGVVGYQMAQVRPAIVHVSAGDLLVLATDGVAAGFGDACGRGTPQQIADDILARYGKATDDALVFAACYRGINPS